MHDATGLIQGDGDFALLLVPLPLVNLLELRLECLQLVPLFERDFEFGQFQGFGVTEALQKHSVSDLGERLVAGPDAALGRNVEDDGFSRNLGGDVLEEHLDLRVGTFAE